MSITGEVSQEECSWSQPDKPLTVCIQRFLSVVNWIQGHIGQGHCLLSCRLAILLSDCLPQSSKYGWQRIHTCRAVLHHPAGISRPFVAEFVNEISLMAPMGCGKGLASTVHMYLVENKESRIFSRSQDQSETGLWLLAAPRSNLDWLSWWLLHPNCFRPSSFMMSYPVDQ